ncbi:MAG: hypothetical protein IJT73_04945 [Selenomonadaceae bacterium]|nr:hypothetical protein [Selenomonadaceae bacterium]
MIREKIEEIFPNQSTESELLTQIKKSGIVYTSSQPAITRIDSNFREALKSIFLRNIVEATAKATEEKEQEIYAEIKEKFLEIMGVSSNSQYRAELLQSLDELFKALWVKNADQCRFNSLVERFTADLLEALIGAPFASIAKERLRKVANDSFKEFISLATYYENYEGALPDDEDRKLDFFLKIFLHENSNTDAETESTLRKFFNDNKQYINAGVSIATEMLPFSKWAKILMRNGIQFNKIPNDLQYKLQSAFYGSNFMDLQPKERSKKLNDIISSYVLENSKISGKLTVEKLEYMYSLGKLKTEIKDEEEMIKVLNEDIAILQKFTLEAVIFAIGLEKAFISVITKNINIIRKDDETEEGKKLFNEWIQKNLGKCRASEFESVETKVLQDQNRRNIIENVRKVVDKLDA